MHLCIEQDNVRKTEVGTIEVFGSLMLHCTSFLLSQLLLNLVESVRQKGEQDQAGREILMRMMEVFILKFQSIADYVIPEIVDRW